MPMIGENDQAGNTDHTSQNSGNPSRPLPFESTHLGDESEPEEDDKLAGNHKQIHPEYV
jgi:hypothetical protein